MLEFDRCAFHQLYIKECATKGLPCRGAQGYELEYRLNDNICFQCIYSTVAGAINNSNKVSPWNILTADHVHMLACLSTAMETRTGGITLSLIKNYFKMTSSVCDKYQVILVIVRSHYYGHWWSYKATKSINYYSYTHSTGIEFQYHRSTPPFSVLSRPIQLNTICSVSKCHRILVNSPKEGHHQQKDQLHHLGSLLTA